MKKRVGEEKSKKNFIWEALKTVGLRGGKKKNEK